MSENIGMLIHQLREEKGMTLEELGDKVGVGKSTVRKWEKGMIQNMRRDKVAKIAAALGVSPAYLMGWPENNTANERSSYYLDPESASIAQAVFDNPSLRILFDAARDVKPENIMLAAELLKKMKETNNDG